MVIYETNLCGKYRLSISELWTGHWFSVVNLNLFEVEKTIEVGMNPQALTVYDDDDSRGLYRKLL